jgi:hypothetical protein
MQFHPFPDAVAPFVARLGPAYEARRAAGRSLDKDGTQRDWPAYRLPSGEVRHAYNVHKPECPEGAEPGLADFSFSKLYGPAGHFDGYQPSPSNFRPF